MRLITRNSDYAIRAVCFMAKRRGSVIPATTLVRELKIPRPFLRKILQILNRKGILTSCRGKGGGFMLKADPDSITLPRLMEIFQGPLRLNECFFKKRICPGRSVCPLKKRIDKIEARALDELRSITIGSLIGTPGR